MAATKTPGRVTAPYTLSWIVLGFRKLWRGAAPDRRRRLSTTGVRLSVCDSGWRSSVDGCGLSIDELSKDCVQRGALDAVVRRRPLIAEALWSAGAAGAGLPWGASTGEAVLALGYTVCSLHTKSYKAPATHFLAKIG